MSKPDLTNKEKFCLRAYVQSQSSENKRLAYICSRNKPVTAEGESLTVSVSRWFTRPEIQKFIEIETERQAIAGRIEFKGEQDATTVSREELLRELSISFRSTNDAKLKSEIGLKIADLQKFKAQTAQIDETKITYFRQINCHECPMYLEKKKELYEKGD